MRWVLYLLLAIAVLTAQSTLSPHAELLGARPDWLLILVVFTALHARRSDAVLSAWLTGMAADLMTVERCGLIAMTYVLITMIIVAIRESLFRDRPLTQFLVTLAACAAVHCAWFIYRRILYRSVQPAFDDFVVGVLFVAAYTALWAPLIHGVLHRMRKLLGFSAPRFGYAP